MQNQESANVNSHGFLAAVASALILATTAIFIRHLTLNYQLPALVLTFWREFIVAMSLLFIFLVVKPALFNGICENFSYLVFYGLVLAFFNASWTLSVAFNGAAIATVLMYSSAAYTAVLGRLILKEKLGVIKIIAVLLSLSGCALVVNAYDPSLWVLNAAGIAAGMFSALGKAGYSLLGRSAAQRGLNPWTTLFAAFATASVMLLAANLGIGKWLPGGAQQPIDIFWLGSSITGWSVLGILAVFPTLLGYGLYNISLKHLPSSVANLVVTIEPVFTAIFAYFLLGELLTPVQVAGSAMILAGVVFTRILEK